MNILNLFINENKVDKVIKTLKGNRDNLKEIVDAEVMNAVKSKYGGKEYPSIAEKYRMKIEQIKDSLYQKYLKEINARLSQLEILRTEVA